MSVMGRRACVLVVVTLLTSVLVSCGREPAAGRLVVDPSVAGERVVVLALPDDAQVAVELTDEHTIALQRRRSGGGWSDPQVIRSVDDPCGGIEAIASGRAVAVVASCDPDWSEDEPSTRDVAVVTTDVTGDVDTWQSARLHGDSDAWGPGISPDGRHAVWTERSGARALVWSAADGFSHRPLAGPRRAETSAVAIDDRGRLSRIVVPDSSGSDGPCVVDISGVTKQRLVVAALKDGCGDASPHLVGPTTVELGEDPTGVTLGTAGGVWKVTRVGPAHTRGLVQYDDPLATELYALSDGAWIAVGSPDRRRVMAQRLAAHGNRWSRPTVIYDHGFPGCSRGSTVGQPDHARPHAVLLVPLSCYRTERADDRYPPRDADGDPLPADGNVALVTADGRSWTARVLGAALPAQAPDGSWVALPGAPLVIVSAAGTEKLSGRSARCDLLVSWTRGTLLRFTGGDASSNYWPTRLETLDVVKAMAGEVDWQTVERIDPSGHTSACATASDASDPGRFVSGQFSGVGGGDVTLLVTEQEKDGSWSAVRRESS